VFGLAPGFALDRRALRKRLLELQRAVHPDFFATRGADARAAAEDATSRLNRAFEVLGDEQRLGDELVRRLGGPSQDEERQMPQAFLMEVLEWNEVLDDARTRANGAGAPALSELRGQLDAARAATLRNLALDLVPLPEHGSPRLRRARQSLNALRYVERALADIERLTG
jgi:molecular chaperone HscB